MDFNDFEPERNSDNEFGGFSRGYGSYSAPRWDDFTLDDEIAAKKRFSRIFLSLFIYQVITFVLVNAAAVVVELFWGDGISEAMNYTILLISNAIAGYAIAFPVLYIIQRPIRKTERAKTNISFGSFMLIFLVAQAFMYFGNIIGQVLNDSIGMVTGVTPDNSIDDIITHTPMYVIIPIVVVIGPIFEELIFRKLLIDKIGIYGDKLAIIVSAIAFGLFHGNLYQFFYATFLGLVLGYIYTRSGNILYPILLHMLINFFGSAVPMFFYDELMAYEELALSFSAGGDVSELINPELMNAETLKVLMIGGLYTMISLGMTVAGIVIFFACRKRIFISDRCEVLIPKRRVWGVVVGNVGAILFLVICGVFIGSEIVMPTLENLLEGGGNVTPDIGGGTPDTDVPSDGGASDIWRHILPWRR